MMKTYFALLTLITTTNSLEQNEQPNIIFILADDLGWNDVGFHGSNDIPTPNIDALAYSGVILNNYYVTPICTPTRSAIMTGKYPIHTGMQHTVLYGSEPRGLPLTEKLLPQYLKEIGYKTHIVGKWHLGHYKLEYTPLFRGFDSHTGYWTGHHDYNQHTAVERDGWGLDMRRGVNVAYDLHGQYTTDLIARESANVIENHNKSSPLFLYMAHAAVHSANPYDPLPAPDDTVAKLSHIENFNRRKFAAMLTHLDDSVGVVVKALEKQNMLKNSIIIFSTDNGGAAAGFNLNAASNWPLKGVKNTLWEGGVRGAALIWSPLIEKPNRVGNQIMHVVDWLPTLYSAAGGNLSELNSTIDGIDVWIPLVKNITTNRNEILHNIDDIWGSAALTVGEWKIVKGTNYNGTWDKWYGPKGDTSEDGYDTNGIRSSNAGNSLKKLNMLPSAENIKNLRRAASIDCGPFEQVVNDCNPLKKPCLYQITEDPCELNNLAEKFPCKLEAMEEKLNFYNATAISPANLPLDPRGQPKHWNYTWTNFGDFI